MVDQMFWVVGYTLIGIAIAATKEMLRLSDREVEEAKAAYERREVRMSDRQRKIEEEAPSGGISALYIIRDAVLWAPLIVINVIKLIINTFKAAKVVWKYRKEGK